METTDILNLSSYLSDETAKLFLSFGSRLNNDRTQTEYAYILAGICNNCCCDFLSLTHRMVASYFNKKQSDYEVTTLQWQAAALRSFSKFVDEELSLRETEENDHHYQNLFPPFPFERINFGASDAPSLSSVDRVLTQLKEDGNFSAFTAISLIVRCALTCSEVCSLCKGSIVADQNRNTGIELRGTTTRYIKLPPDIIEILNIVVDPAGDNDSPLLLTKRGRPLSKRSLERYLQDTCKQIGISGFSLYQLRNLAIGSMLAGGSPQTSIAEYVGTGVQWITRYEKCIPQLEHAAVDYNHIRIVL